MKKKSLYMQVKKKILAEGFKISVRYQDPRSYGYRVKFRVCYFVDTDAAVGTCYYRKIMKILKETLPLNAEPEGLSLRTFTFRIVK